jgi:hypothetical protein
MNHVATVEAIGVGANLIFFNGSPFIRSTQAPSFVFLDSQTHYDLNPTRETVGRVPRAPLTPELVFLAFQRNASSAAARQIGKERGSSR